MHFEYFENMKSEIINIFKYIVKVRISMGFKNISVQVGFGSGSQNLKILDAFGYLISFGSSLILLFDRIPFDFLDLNILSSPIQTI